MPRRGSTYEERTRAALAGLLLEGRAECNMETIVIRVHHLSQLEGRGLGKRHEEYIRNALMKEYRRRRIRFDCRDGSITLTEKAFRDYANHRGQEDDVARLGRNITKAQAMQESEERLEILLQLRRYLAMYENHQEGELVLDVADAYATPGVITSDELKEIPEKIKGMLEDLHRHSKMVGPFLEILKTIAGIP